MIATLLIGREGSVGFPGKNVYPVLGRPMMVYPLLAALNCKYVDEVFLSTDSKKMKEIALSFNVKIIDRPAELCTKEALSEDVWVHGYQYMKNTLGYDIEMMILLFCNAPTILAQKLQEGVEVLRSNETLDSAVTVSIYNMFSPVRARKIGRDGTLEPFIPFDIISGEGIVNSDRSGLGDVYFADCSGYVVRPRCLENINEGMLPQKWMGKRICPLKQWGGCDVDYEWQIPQVEYWLRRHGFTRKVVPYDNIKGRQ